MKEFSSPLKKHIFVCENRRNLDDPCSSCAVKGSLEVTAALKKLCNAVPELKGKVRINRAGCLGQCEGGVIVVIYPAGIWLRNVLVSDAEQIFNQYILDKK